MQKLDTVTYRYKALACSASLFILFYFFTAKHCRHGFCYLLICRPFSKVLTWADGNHLAERFLKSALRRWLETTGGEMVLVPFLKVGPMGNSRFRGCGVRHGPGCFWNHTFTRTASARSCCCSLLSHERIPPWFTLRHPSINSRSLHWLSCTFFFFIPLFKSTSFGSVYGFVRFLSPLATH